jgi:hypothetical protein
MHIAVLGDRRVRLRPGWSKEIFLSVFGDSEVDASVAAEAGGSLTVIGLFSDTTVTVPPGSNVSETGFSILGDRRVEVGPGDGAAIRIKGYGLFCDLKVVESSANSGRAVR